jgi:hypothetical protein
VRAPENSQATRMVGAFVGSRMRFRTSSRLSGGTTRPWFGGASDEAKVLEPRVHAAARGLYLGRLLKMLQLEEIPRGPLGIRLVRCSKLAL